MLKYDKEDRLYYTSNGGIRLKRYLDELPGLPCQTLWTDINPINSQAKEKIGYPTQKPEALLERIIKCASNEGGIVLDPFMGGGTTIAVADRLNRKWIGIDQSPQAVKVTEFRLNRQQNPRGQKGLYTEPFTVELHKYDYDTLYNQDPFEFEGWIVRQFGGIPNIKKRGDKGVDGKAADSAPVQVKQQEAVGVDVIDKFLSAAQRFDETLFAKNRADKKPVGYIIAFSFGKGTINEAGRLNNETGTIIKLVRVEDIVPIVRRPKITLAVNDLTPDRRHPRTIECVASAESAAGIRFFSWDFDYFPDIHGFLPAVFYDKTGRQTHDYEPGHYCIGVKAVDNDGLESIESVKIKLNGTVETT
jgi:hypothetical protein